MSKFLDYLTLKSPGVAAMGTGESNPHLYLSLFGLLIGILFSFLITGIQKKAPESASEQTKTEITTNTSNTTEQGDITFAWPKRNQLIAWIIISFVIGALTYPMLYNKLKTQVGNPALLIFFTSFEFGFFWQSVLSGTSKLAI